MGKERTERRRHRALRGTCAARGYGCVGEVSARVTGVFDPLRTYRTLTWRRSETLLSTRQQTAFASPANPSIFKVCGDLLPVGLRSFPPERCSMHLAPL